MSRGGGIGEDPPSLPLLFDCKTWFCATGASRYVHSGVLCFLQPLGLLLLGGGVGSLGGRPVQGVGDSAHQGGDGAADRGRHMFGSHLFCRKGHKQFREWSRKQFSSGLFLVVTELQQKHST